MANTKRISPITTFAADMDEIIGNGFLKDYFDKETEAGRLSAKEIADRRHVLACIARNKA